MRFYTGVPTRQRDRRWPENWTRRLTAMRRADGSTETVYVPGEKCIDLRLALDVVRIARTNRFNVALVSSQDQDLAEMAAEVRRIAGAAGRRIQIASAFPASPTATSRRGIDGTEWIRIDEVMYDANLDPGIGRSRTDALREVLEPAA